MEAAILNHALNRFWLVDVIGQGLLGCDHQTESRKPRFSAIKSLTKYIKPTTKKTAYLVMLSQWKCWK